MEGYFVKALGENGEEKIVYTTTDAQAAAEMADELRKAGYEAINIERYK